jgi:hypothetical protein
MNFSFTTYLCGILLVISAMSFAYGRYEHTRYIEFKAEVESIAKSQEAHVESIKKQQEIVTKGIQNEYDAKLAAIRNYYKSTSVWNNPSSDKVSGISPAPSVSDVIASYNQLAGQCAETTAQTIALQDWIKEQMGIK